MNEISTVKTVRASGSSLTVYITRELNMLKVGKGDSVEVTLKKIKN